MYYILEVTTTGNSQDEVERYVYTDIEEAQKAFDDKVKEKIDETVVDNDMNEQESEEYEEDLIKDILDSVMDVSDPEYEWQVALFKTNN